MNGSFPRENQLENVSVEHGIINGLESEAGGFRLVYFKQENSFSFNLGVPVWGEGKINYRRSFLEATAALHQINRAFGRP